MSRKWTLNPPANQAVRHHVRPRNLAVEVAAMIVIGPLADRMANVEAAAETIVRQGNRLLRKMQP
jgi:hypothetical protein